VADASQDGSTVQGDKCKVCKNGSPSPIDVNDTETEDSLSFQPPDETIKKINEGLEKLSNIGVEAKLNLLKVTGTLKTKQCCGKETGLGQEVTGSVTGNFGGFSLSGRIFPAPGTPNPSIKVTVDAIGLFTLEFKGEFKGGVFLNGDVKVSGQIGFRKKGCDEKAVNRAGCFFATLDNAVTVGATAQVAVEGSLSFDCPICTKFTVTAEGKVIIGDFSWTINISSVSFNNPDCDSGVSGGLFQPQPGKFKIGAELSGSWSTAGVTHKITKSVDLLSCKITLSSVTCE